MDKKVSIVIPAYNSEKYIKDCILSLQRQTYKNIEIIVVNDGSKDSTLEILNELAKEYNNLIVLTQENHGIAYTRNRGIEFATGEYLMFMDNDDYLDKDYIEQYVNGFEEYREEKLQNHKIRDPLRQAPDRLSSHAAARQAADPGGYAGHQRNEQPQGNEQRQQEAGQLLCRGIGEQETAHQQRHTQNGSETLGQIE